MPWVSVALAVASYAANRMAQEDQRKRQDSLAAQDYTYRKGKSDESTAAIQKFTKTLTPEEREAQFLKEQGGIRQNLDASVGANKSFQTPTATSGKVTADFTNKVAQNTATTGDRLNTILQSLSIMGAPGQRQQTSNIDLHTAAGLVDGANGAANRVGGYYQQAIAGQQPSPGLSLLGGALGGASMATSANTAKSSPVDYTATGGYSAIPGGALTTSAKLAKLLEVAPTVVK